MLLDPIGNGKPPNKGSCSDCLGRGGTGGAVDDLLDCEYLCISTGLLLDGQYDGSPVYTETKKKVYY